MGEFLKSVLEDEIEVLKCADEITIKNAQEFKNHLEEFLKTDKQKMLLDLSDTTYMNSAALGCIADMIMKSKKSKKTMVIGGITPTIQEIFKIIKLDVIVTLCIELEEAKQFLKEK